MNDSTRYAYTHAVCGGSVTKAPTGKSSVSYTGLHGWTCNKCGERGVKVSRTMRVKAATSDETTVSVPDTVIA